MYLWRLVEGGRDYLLHAGSGFFEFLRELDVAVVLLARSGRDEAADDDVFLEAAQAVGPAVGLFRGRQQLSIGSCSMAC